MALSTVTPSATNTYKINGAETAIAPTTITWTPKNVGYQGDNKPLTSAYWDVILTFSAGNLEGDVNEWLTVGYTNTLVTVSIPGKFSLDFVDISNVSFEIQSPPTLETVVLGGFTLAIKGVLVV